MIGLCGLCGTPLQPLSPQGTTEWWRFADPGDDATVAAVKAHVAMIHDDLAYLPPLIGEPQT